MSAILIFGATAALAGQVTFYKDVLPVLQSRCQGCHRPGEAAPMTFMDYQSTRPWAKAIKQAVLSRRMPPWFADPHVGSFTNDRSLTRQEMDVLIRWVDSGSPQGAPADAPKPMEWVEGWRIGQPDQVFEMPMDFDVPATGTIEYTYFLIPTNFKEDRWIEASEARPGNRAVVHHIIAFVREPGSRWLREIEPGVPYVPQGKRTSEGAADDGMADDWLAGYAPGSPAFVLKPGQARLVKAGSDIILQMHYTANGKAGKDRSKVGIRFSRSPVDERVLIAAAANRKFVIPPGARNHSVRSSITFSEPVKLRSLLPHMHVRGKSFSYRAIYPDGTIEPLLNVPRYDFNWQLMYEMPRDKLLPAGTRIECDATYDNSPNNPYNPDPAVEVRWGDQSWDEMMAGFFEMAVAKDKTLRDVFRRAGPPAASE
jgi:hypothetical protein